MLGILNSYLFLIFLTTLAISNNLILFFISWIGLNISLYGILLKSFNSYNIEITLKYFISGSVITIFMLFSMLLFFMDYFSFNFENVSYLFYNFGFYNNISYKNDLGSVFISKYQKIYYITIVMSLLFKLGSFPFHFYIPEMYESLDIKKNMLVYTVILKVGIFLTLIKLLSNFWFLNIVVHDYILCSGLGSIFISSFSILKQYKLKKFLAFSYLNSIGYTLICLSFSIFSDYGEISFYLAKVYFYIYILSWLGIFDIMCTAKFINRNGIVELFYVSDLLFLSDYEENNQNNNNENMYIKTAMLLLLVGMSGLPPMLGFFSKSLLFFELVSSPNSGFSYIIVLVLTPIVAFGYIKVMLNLIYKKINNYFKFENFKNLTNSNKKKNIIFFENNLNTIFNYKIITKFMLFSPIFVYFFEKINLN